MFCEKCGNAIEDDAVFCMSCGEKVNFDIPPSVEDNMMVTTKKPLNKKMIAIITFFSAVLIVLVSVICINSLSKVNAEDFINKEIKFSGFNGYGTVQVEDVIDYNAIIKALGCDSDSQHANYMFFTEYIDVSIPNSNLSNGKTITATISINYDAINQLDFKKKLVGNDIITHEYTVSGLSNTIEINPFDIIESVCIYNSGTYSASIIYNFKSDYKMEYADGEIFCVPNKDNYNSFDVQKLNGDEYETVANIKFENNYSKNKIQVIKAGMEVPIQISCKSDDFISNGFVFTETEKQYVLKDIKYLDDVKEISSDIIKMKEYILELTEYSESDLYKVYYVKRDNIWGDDICLNNAIYFVFKVTSGFETYGFKDIRVDSDYNIIYSYSLYGDFKDNSLEEIEKYISGSSANRTGNILYEIDF